MLGLASGLALSSIGTGSNWCIALLRPGNHPLRNLAEAMFHAMAKKDGEAERRQETASDLRDAQQILLTEAELRRGPRDLIDLVLAARGNFDA